MVNEAEIQRPEIGSLDYARVLARKAHNGAFLGDRFVRL